MQNYAVSKQYYTVGCTLKSQYSYTLDRLRQRQSSGSAYKKDTYIILINLRARVKCKWVFYSLTR